MAVSAILLIANGGGKRKKKKRKRPPIILQPGGQKRIKRKPLIVSMCKSLLEMSQQIRSKWIFARKQVTVCFVRVNYKLLLLREQENRSLNIKTLP